MKKRLANLIAVVVIAGALSAACGRKGPLEPAPDDDRDRQENLSR